MNENRKKTSKKGNFEAAAQLFGKLVSIICVLGSILVAYFCITKYIDKPTTLNVKRINTMESGFPEFTICPDSFGYKYEDMKIYNITSKDILLKDGANNFNWDIFNNITLTLDEIIFFVNFRAGERYFQLFPKKSQILRENLHETIEGKYGKCATLTIPEVYKKMNLNAVIITSKLDGINMFIHYPGQYFPGPNSQVVGKMNKPLFIDLKFTLLQEISGEQCDSTLNGIIINFKINE